MPFILGIHTLSPALSLAQLAARAPCLPFAAAAKDIDVFQLSHFGHVFGKRIKI